MESYTHQHDVLTKSCVAPLLPLVLNGLYDGGAERFRTLLRSPQ